MERETRRVFTAVAVIVAALLVVRFWAEIRRPFLPKLEAVHVAVLPEGEDVARTGTTELAAGSRFRLFAVLVAESFGGRRTVFTEAPRLALDGEELSSEVLRPWPSGGRPARVRWRTLEGFSPYLPLESDGDLERFRLEESFHADWGSAWSVDGVVDPRNVQLDPGSPLRPLPFGTQRYQARVEIYDSDEAITPAEKLESTSADAALAAPATVTAVAAALPGPLARLSRAFGLTQLDPGTGISAAVAERVAALHRSGLAFERVALLAEHVAAAGGDPSALDWTAIDLAAAPPAWSADCASRAPGAACAGDFLQAGRRIVALFADEGTAGRIDPADLVFDFHRGAKVRRLDEVFRESGGLELEWAAVARRALAESR